MDKLNTMNATLGDLMSPQVKVISPRLTLDEVARLMMESRISCLVVEENRQLLGILTERDMVKLLHHRTNSTALVAEVMSSPVITARPEETFRNGMMLMREMVLRHLVIVGADGGVLGVVSESDMRARLSNDMVGRVRNLQAALDRKSPALEPGVSLAVAVERMVAGRWDYVVVTQDDVPLGILTERDIPHLLAQKIDPSITLDEVMSKPVMTIPFEAELFDAMRLMSERRFRHLVAVDSAGKLVGVLSQHGLLERVGFELIGDNLHELEALRAIHRESERAFRKSEQHFRAVFEQAAVGVSIVSPLGKWLEVNQRLCDMLGYTHGELMALSFQEITPSECRENDSRQMRDMLEGVTENASWEKRYFHKNGQIIWVRITSVLVRDTLNQPDYFVTVTEDVSDRVLAEKNLQRLNSDLSATLHAIPDMLFEMDCDGRFLNIWAHDAKLLATQKKRLLGRTATEVLSPEAAEQIKAAISDADQHGYSSGQIVHIALAQGDSWFELSTAAKAETDTASRRFIMLSRDVSERVRKDDLIWRQAYFDALTGLPNRRLFRDRLEQEIKKSHRTQLPLALLFIDLDNFKEVNDTIGHDQGDNLLVEVTRRIRECVRETDTLARLGGDEFAVILPEFGANAYVERIAQEILQTLCAPLETGNHRNYVSASIGITIYPDDTQDVEGLLKQADRAMYLAKEQGRNRFAYFTEAMQQKAEAKLSLTNDLRQALARRELMVYYQPIVEVTTGRIVKAEALLRWRHPLRGMVSPAEFIPLAEESGLILEIGDWVFNQAVVTIKRWHDKYGQLIPVSVNKSPLQFSDETQHGDWAEIIHRLDLPRNSVVVEITEGVLIKNSPAVKNRLLEFQNQGIEVAIDDFGTGFSSLSYLKQFDVDFLKIDRSFVEGLADDASDRVLTEAIIVMAHKLGIKTIAEGVETHAQRDLLAAFGCDYIQGYLYSRPLDLESFEALLEQSGSGR